jgi:hypothetical protein
MKTSLTTLLCAAALLTVPHAWAEQSLDAPADMQSLPQIMPEGSAQAENCDSDSAGCKQVNGMRGMMSDMMAAGSDMAGTACGSDCEAAAANTTEQMERRMDRMQTMMGRMMGRMVR